MDVNGLKFQGYGYPFQKKPLEDHVNWDKYYSEMDPRRKHIIKTKLDEIGDSGRNSLKRPNEYISLILNVKLSIDQMFSNDPNIGCYVFNEVETYFDKNTHVSSHVGVIHFCLFGENIPSLEEWEWTLRGQNLSTSVKEIKDVNLYTLEEKIENVTHMKDYKLPGELYKKYSSVGDCLKYNTFYEQNVKENTIYNDNGDEKFKIREFNLGSEHWNYHFFYFTTITFPYLESGDILPVHDPETLKREHKNANVKLDVDEFKKKIQKKNIDVLDAVGCQKFTFLTSMFVLDENYIFVNVKKFLENNGKRLLGLMNLECCTKEEVLNRTIKFVKENLKVFRVKINLQFTPFNALDMEVSPNNAVCNSKMEREMLRLGREFRENKNGKFQSKEELLAEIMKCEDPEYLLSEDDKLYMKKNKIIIHTIPNRKSYAELSKDYKSLLSTSFKNKKK